MIGRANRRRDHDLPSVAGACIREIDVLAGVPVDLQSRDPSRRIDGEEEAHVLARDDLVLDAEPLVGVVVELPEEIPAAEGDDARVDPPRQKRAVGQSLVIEVEIRAG